MAGNGEPSAAAQNPFSPRTRAVYAACAIGAVAAGLLTRSRFLDLPRTVAKYSGDAVWALLVFFLLGFLFPRKPTWRIALLAAAFATTIEFLQLYHAPWINHLRSLWIGRMILGSTFNPPDLLAYAAGIFVGILLDRILASRLRGRP
jgi:hypothetical protein